MTVKPWIFAEVQCIRKLQFIFKLSLILCEISYLIVKYIIFLRGKLLYMFRSWTAEQNQRYPNFNNDQFWLHCIDSKLDLQINFSVHLYMCINRNSILDPQSYQIKVQGLSFRMIK